MPWIVGLTGGIGSGKTAVSDWFSEQGIAVVDADVVAREVVERGSAGLAQMQARFGDWVVTETGDLDRVALRKRVFDDPALRAELEAITHPLIRQRMVERLMAAQSPYVLLVAPLLLEAGRAGLAAFCQRILVVDVPEALQQERASTRDQQTPDAIAKIIATQLPRAERLKHADDVVTNAGGLDSLHDQLKPLHQQYLQTAQAAAHL